MASRHLRSVNRLSECKIELLAAIYRIKISPAVAISLGISSIATHPLACVTSGLLVVSLASFLATFCEVATT